MNIKTKLEEIVNEESKMMDYFNEKRIDYCCNGYMTIEEVAKEKGLKAEDLLDMISDAFQELKSSKPSQSMVTLEEFKTLNFKEMIDSILVDHHKKERDYLNSIDPLLNKILIVHFDNHSEELLELHKLFGSLKTELEEHFVKEEKISFPLILNNPNPNEEIIKKIDELEDDHESAGIIIKQMISLTDGFTPPEDACRTFKKTYSELDELTKDVFVHIFKENSIMFKKFREIRS
ncbi:MAG: DUF542 domain-containing protein [Lagierella massiliensis]|nr:DUF542 domain-containing protein [Lagierella massiliensis]